MTTFDALEELFPQFFLSCETTLMFLVTFDLLSSDAFNLGKPKILLSGKELMMILSYSTALLYQM